MPRKVLIHMYVTLDGVAEYTEDRDLGPDASGEFWETMWAGPWKDVDTILLGRKTYVKWAEHWPARVDDEDEHARTFARFSTRVDKVVFSQTLATADWSKSRIFRGPVAEEIGRLRSLPGQNIFVGGGSRFVQSVLAEDLADELYLSVTPSIVGRGRPLFRLDLDPDSEEDGVPLGAPGRHDFRLLETRALRSGLVLLHYAATGGAKPSP